jgi:hypothetical protein
MSLRPMLVRVGELVWNVDHRTGIWIGGRTPSAWIDLHGLDTFVTADDPEFARPAALAVSLVPPLAAYRHG